MTPEQQRLLAEMERWGQAVGRAVEETAREQFGRKMGFVVFIFDFSEQNLCTYLSNANRDDCVKALKELIQHIEQKGFTGTTQGNN